MKLDNQEKSLQLLPTNVSTSGGVSDRILVVSWHPSRGDWCGEWETCVSSFSVAQVRKAGEHHRSSCFLATSQWKSKPQYHFFCRKSGVIQPCSLQRVMSEVTCQCGQWVSYLNSLLPVVCSWGCVTGTGTFLWELEVFSRNPDALCCQVLDLCEPSLFPSSRWLLGEQVLLQLCQRTNPNLF